MNKIPCGRCDHESDTDLAAFEHWRDTHKRREGEELGPGLHRVGPAPYDYVYNPAEGQRVGSIVDGELHMGTVTGFVEDKATGSITLTVQPDLESMEEK